MKLQDYFRLASAGLWQNKGQTLKIILIMGSMFAFIMTMGFLTWGAEDVSIAKINQPTGRQILVYTTIDTTDCWDDCGAEINQAKDAIRKYDGKVVERAGSVKTKDGELAVLPADLVQRAIEVEPEHSPNDATPILIPTRIAIEWLGLLGDRQPTFNADEGVFDFGPEATVDTIKTVRERALGQIITSPTSERYFVVGFLPSNVANSYSLRSDSGFLSLFIDRTTVGSSNGPIVIDNNNVDKYEDGQHVWATFEDVEAAYKYYTDQEQQCNRSLNDPSLCMHVVASPFGFALDPKWSYGPTENLFWLIVGIFGVLAIIVNIITLVRLVGRNFHTALLYYRMGAKSGQIRAIYILHMIILCFLTSSFVLIVSSMLCLIINIIHAGTLAELYALGFGTLEEPILLIGWRWEVLVLIGMVFTAVPLATLLSWRKMVSKD